MIDVAWIVIRKQSRFLLAQRSPNDKAGGAWVFPGGKKDSIDNNLIQTARRELLEEVGLKGSDFHQLLQISQNKYRIWIFACLKWIGQPQPNCNDIVGIGWFTLQEMYAMKENLAPYVNTMLPELAYCAQHYKAHPEEWKW